VIIEALHVADITPIVSAAWQVLPVDKPLLLLEQVLW
jgi:hypothetical protein